MVRFSLYKGSICTQFDQLQVENIDLIQQNRTYRLILAYIKAMAPSVETAHAPTLNPAFREPPTGPVEYKVFATGPSAYKPEAEEKGTDKQPAATYPKYLPTWDAETSMQASATDRMQIC
jgi:hypothetical protein